MIEAWLRASEITASRSSSKASKTPPLASKHDPNKIVSSAPRKCDNRSSRVRWMVWVPQMNRTDAIPKPQVTKASRAASTTRGSSARPR